MPQLQLGLAGFSRADLFSPEGLNRLDGKFLEFLGQENPDDRDALLAYRAATREFSGQETSELLLRCGPVLERFVSSLFGIAADVETLRLKTCEHGPVFAFKKLFVQRRARRRLLSKDELETFAVLDSWLSQQLGAPQGDRELAVSRYSERLLAEPEKHPDEIEKLTRWCIRALTVPEGQSAVSGWVSFKLPQPTDHDQLVPVQPVNGDESGRVQTSPLHFRPRDGFKLTDPRMGAREVQNEVNYCIYCHDHDGDFCSKGFLEKKGEPDKGLKKNPLGVVMTGCPLGEKISEMHALKRDGHSIASLAMVMVDNPMCPATGHRICNDCMKACIYQKQDPVNIPQIETRVLTDVLALPWGVEIYDLLTRWNPLRRTQFVPKPYNGKKVLIAGMGPSGFTLAHHLLQEGCAVVGTEGLKIEPLPELIVTEPVRDYSDLVVRLDTRVMTGFGGVAEYGITVRWDKNFLKLIYLTLARRSLFQVFGGVRFGGTITVENAWELGFDHVAIAVGAGLPQALPIPGSLAPGMRQANDFLMALQLSGAAKSEGLANLQVRLPAVIVGGGLTGVDTATEVQAYYIVQVEKTLARYETLEKELGAQKIRAQLDAASLAILDEFLEHGRAVRSERDVARTEQRDPNFIPLLRQWGGVTIAYRKSMKDSPAYTRNHEEVIKALEEGLYYAEHLEPKRATLDTHGHVSALVCTNTATQQEVTLPARAILVATGARPNVAYEFEHKGHFVKERGHYQTFRQHDNHLEPVAVAPHCKDEFGAFTSYTNGDKRVSLIGDAHPVFHGSVVKAVASGLQIYPRIMDALGAPQETQKSDYAEFSSRIASNLSARVVDVRRVHDRVVKLTVHAPLAAARFKPGQFFRLQNFESRAATLGQVKLQTEALALTGAYVDKTAGTVSLLVVEGGASSRMVSALQPGDPVSLMGPGGVRTKIPDESPETVLIVAGPIGVPHALGVAPAMRSSGNRVILFAVFENERDVFMRDELAQVADHIEWVMGSKNIVSALQTYAAGNPSIPLSDVDRMIIVADSCTVRILRDARRNELKPVFPKGPSEVIASINTPMQCMLKGVCSQCLQWQIDPTTGKRTKAVFGCSWQDQPVDIVDLDNLDERLSQNRMQERLTNLWLDYLFKQHDARRV